MSNKDGSFFDDDFEDDFDEVEFKGKYSQWLTDGDKFFPTGKTIKKLKPGVYSIGLSISGPYFQSRKIKEEKLIRFPDTETDKVIDEIIDFWGKQELFEQFKIPFKRGIMLYGPPGSGKSCCVRLIMDDVVKRGGIVVDFSRPDVYQSGMEALRQIHPDMPVVTIMEDIDSILSMSNESEILNILDGHSYVHKTVFLATTNYPESLGARIMNRPSRFDKRFRIGFLNAESRRVYLENTIGVESIARFDIDLDRWVQDTDGYSIAHLKELFVSVIILENKYQDAIATLNSMKMKVEETEWDSEFDEVPCVPSKSIKSARISRKRLS